MKVSVSELKHAAIEVEPESCHWIDPEAGEEATLPKFMKEGQTVSGASRGTVYHKLLERVDIRDFADWGQNQDSESLERQLAAWCTDGIFTKEEVEAVDIRQMMRLSGSSVIGRMARAAEAGHLYREKPFVMGVPADRIDAKYISGELVVIQGIIDVYWQEGDGLYLLDYKTDRVNREDGEQILKNRYRVQLEYYAEALSRATGLPVKEKRIYSFPLGKLISL